MPTPDRTQLRRAHHLASRLKHVAAWAAIVPLAFTLAAPAQAQSRYAMTMLKPPFLGATDSNLFIDAQDRVLGFAGYFKSAGYALDPSGSGKLVWVTTYNSYLSTWPVSTAASVTSTKLFANVFQTLPIDDISPDGSKILIKQSNYKPIVYDAVSKQAVAYPGGGLQEPPLGERSSANAVNNKGWSAGFAQLVSTQNGETLYRTQAMRWRLSQAEALPTDTTLFVGSEAKAINTLGEAAGEVDSVVNNRLIPHAAAWGLNGSLRVLDQIPGHLTRAAAIADNGTVLVERTVLTDTTQVGSLELHANGQITVLTPPSPGGVFAAMNKRSLSADGSTVVGAWAMQPTAGQNLVLRAFIHKQGLTQDLTTLAKAKGVKLPTGAYFSTVASINAMGSMLATYVDSKGMNPVQVRLTPVP
jgi:uncharacterized membrane protein